LGTRIAIDVCCLALSGAVYIWNGCVIVRDDTSQIVERRLFDGDPDIVPTDYPRRPRIDQWLELGTAAVQFDCIQEIRGQELDRT